MPALVPPGSVATWRPGLLASVLLGLAGCRADPKESAGDSPRDTSAPLAPVPFEWVGYGPSEAARLGFSIASAGDIDADGLDDIVLGARDATLDTLESGAAQVYLGREDGVPILDWAGQPDLEEARYGESVAGVGDVDADGFDDVMVGAAEYQAASGTGRLYLYHGSANGLPAEATWTADSTQRGSWLGRWVSAAGDIDADGYADVVVGDKYYDTPAIDGGRIALYRGGPTGLPAAPDWEYMSDTTRAYLGFSVAGAGDVNGDGFDEIIAGASFSDEDVWRAGRIWLFEGGAGGLSAEAAWTVTGDSEGAMLGYPVARMGDVDGDGYADVGAGAIGWADVGQACAWYGSAMGLPESASWSTMGEQTGEEYGYGVTGAGDLDADGFDDLLVSARNFTDTAEQEGRVLVFRGGADGLDTESAWQRTSGQAGATLGSSVASAGDANGDGFPDLLLGAEYYDGPTPDSGAVWLLGGVLAEPGSSGD